MHPITRLVRTAVLLAGPVVLAARAVRGLVAVPGRAATAVRGSEREPVAGPLFAVPEPAPAPVPAVSRPPAAQPAAPPEPTPTPPEPTPTPPPTSIPEAAFQAAAKPAAREELPVYASDLPIASYDALNVRDASTAIKELTEPEQVRLILRYEEENAKRTTVHRAARVHLESLEGATL